jgi:RNA polymerase sigma-70 factor (ECF subfamily)
VLHDDAVASSDGGADQRAARHPAIGADRIAVFFRGIPKKGLEGGAVIDIERVRVNGAPGLTIHLDGALYLTAGFDLRPDAGGEVRIATIHSVLNPEEPRHLD